MNLQNLLSLNRQTAVRELPTFQIERHKVLRNTYLLLGMTLVVSALVAGLAANFNLPSPGIIVTLVGYFGLLFLASKFRNNTLGLGFVFALTGFMGYTLGPILNTYLGLPNGSEIVLSAMSGTAIIFLGLSAFALLTRKNFSFMSLFLSVGIVVGFFAGLAAIFFELPALALAVSAVFVLLMSGLILYETSNIIHGGETNYIMATVTLYVSIFNLFTSLLQLLGFVNRE